jgi:hypothetical protein
MRIGNRKMMVSVMAMAAIVAMALLAAHAGSDPGNGPFAAVAAVVTAFCGGNLVEHLKM